MSILYPRSCRFIERITSRPQECLEVASTDVACSGESLTAHIWGVGLCVACVSVVIESDISFQERGCWGHDYFF